MKQAKIKEPILKALEVDNMRKLIETLKQLDKDFPVEDNFSWEVPSGNGFIEIPNLSIYEKNVFLKENAKEILLDDNSLEFHYWIIQEWGGIKSFKKNDKNNSKIKKFNNELSNHKMTSELFSTISSLSKISSFLDCENYFIYDSRVIYTLNWLLIKHTEEEEVLFPQPAGRNREILKYDIFTIYRLLNKNEVRQINYGEAYANYCELIKNLSLEVYGKKYKAYRLEMLLFILSTKYIVDDIKETVEIQFK